MVGLAVDEVGDVETVGPVDHRAFGPWLTPWHRVWIGQADDDGRLKRLLTVRTRKESATKGIGVGRGLPFAALSAMDDAAGDLLAVVLGCA